DKLPTEEEVTDLKTLRDYLEKKQHPVIQRWTKEEAAAEAPQSGASAPAWSAAQAFTMPAGIPMMPPMQFGGGEGMKLVFKNAKITIDRIVLKGKEK
ncbi:MAG: acetyl-CoA decarbonylase/synthase complex subunit beta, partial [Candidatus Methanoperedens sp.]|nr:acetyl-CoA decarbonylase/synthase complex subunit beta [Candidatus Methanoperedens sp.]